MATGGRFSRYLSPASISCEIPEKGREKWSLLKKVTEDICKEHSLNAEQSKVAIENILKREHALSTAIGDSIAVPHCSFPGIRKPLLHLVILKEGVDFEAHDRKPVHIIAVILLPEKDYRRHLALLPQIVDVLQQPGFYQSVLQCSNAEEVIQLVSSREKSEED